jgi:uncharacterized protein
MQRFSRRGWFRALFGAGLAAATPRVLADQWRAPLRDPSHTFESYVTSWRELQRRNVVMQSYDYSCGAASIATVLQFYWGDPVSEKQVIDAFLKVVTVDELKDRIKHGMSITDLRHTSVELGYLASIGTSSFDQLAETKIPVIVPIKVKKFDHFVVFRGVADGRAYLADPVRGNVRPTVYEFCNQWIKNSMLVIVKKGESPREESPLTIRQSEVDLGATTDQWLDRALPRPLIHGGT